MNAMSAGYLTPDHVPMKPRDSFVACVTLLLIAIASAPEARSQGSSFPADSKSVLGRMSPTLSNGPQVADTTVLCGFGHCSHGTDVCCRNGGIFWCCPAGTTQCIPNGGCGHAQAAPPPVQSQADYVTARYYCRDAATGRDAGDITSTTRGASCAQACNNARVYFSQVAQDPCQRSDNLKRLSHGPDWIQGGPCTNVRCW